MVTDYTLLVRLPGIRSILHEHAIPANHLVTTHQAYQPSVITVDFLGFNHGSVWQPQQSLLSAHSPG